jgi:hypothetical protein
VFEVVAIKHQAFLDRHQMELKGELHASAALTRRESPRYTFEKRLGEVYNRPGRCDQEKNL